MYYDDIGLDFEVTDFNPALYGPKYPGPTLYGLGDDSTSVLPSELFEKGDVMPPTGPSITTTPFSWWDTLKQAAPGIQTGFTTGFKSGSDAFSQYKTQVAIPNMQQRKLELDRLKALRQEQRNMLESQYGSALARTQVVKGFTGWKTWAIVGVLAFAAVGGFAYLKKRGA